MSSISKIEALRLLPLVVDNEADEESRQLFLQYVEGDDDVRRKYASMKVVKELLRNRMRREKAPDGLKQRIHELITGENSLP